MKKLFTIFAAFLLLILCAIPAGAAENARRLELTVTADEDIPYTPIASDPGYSGDFAYMGVRDVSILLGDRTLPLEDALRDGAITVPELVAYARMDARNNLCWERRDSKNGLAYFTYCYPEYDVKVAYDLYELPNGTKKLVDYFGVYLPGLRSQLFFPDPASPLGYYLLDREDWGLDISVSDVSDQAVTLDIRQSGGQQFGALIITDAVIFTSEDGTLDSAKRIIEIPFDPQVEVSMGSRTSFTIHLPIRLETGEYYLRLHIQDVYDPETLHPLTRNYYDEQSYFLEFSVGD